MTHSCDVLVVGGGINGVGIAQASAAAGWSVAVLEKSALAAGTSSKSSKLVHGGLRYLESYEFGLVRESLRERQLLLRLAPELVQRQTFCIPLYASTRRAPWLLRTGLSLYYLLSGCATDARFGAVPQREWAALDGLRTDNLRAVFRYTDARTDDAALTRAVMRSAESLGAQLCCPAELLAAELTDDGVEVTYGTPEGQQNCRARVVVNATGPWVNAVLGRVQPHQTEVPVELVQGTHIEVPGSMSRDFYYVESPRDGRAVFVMPRDGRIVIGTTETRYRKNPDHVAPLPAEENYLLRVAAHYFPQFDPLRRGDLLASWAGLRVLPGGEGHAFHRSREIVLQTDRRGRPRWLTVYGGKLTSYRATAEKVVERIAESLPDGKAVADTKQLMLSP